MDGLLTGIRKLKGGVKMRYLISLDAARALKNEEKFSRSNTKVKVGKDLDGVKETILYLYDNPIAGVKKGELYIKTSTWFTATTKDRLNTVLEEFEYPFIIIQRRGVWYFALSEDIKINYSEFEKGKVPEHPYYSGRVWIKADDVLAKLQEMARCS